MQQIKFPCPDCKGVSAHVHMSGFGFEEGLCLTCCGIGTKHMGRWNGEFLPRDLKQRRRMTEAYRKYADEMEKT